MSQSRDIDLDTPVVAAQAVVAAGHPGETVILEPGSSAYFGLDEVGTRVWEEIQKPVKVSTLVDTLESEYDVDRPTLEHDLLALLREMAARGLIDVGGAGAA